jgi:hypothetical protein
VETFSGKEGLLPFTKVSDARYIVVGGGKEEAGRNMDKVGARCQVFYGAEEVLEGREWKWRGLGLNRSRGGSGSGEDSPRDGGGERERERERGGSQADERGRRVREVVEAVERTLCTVFYD